MGFQKFSLFLALSILVLYQAGSLHAVPFRSTLESSPDLATLSEGDLRLLLAELVQNYVQMKARELELEEKQEAEDSSLDSSRSKRCGNLSTCMLGTYTQELNKFHTFPQTAIGVGAPGKKRDVSSNLETDYYPYIGMPHVTAEKRSCNTATCMTHRLAGLLSRSGGIVKDDFVPTNVDSNAFGRRRRDLQD